jgi:hypothetical protein
VVALAALGASAHAAQTKNTATCTPRSVTAAYAASVQQAVSSKRDLWGGELLRAKGGPTYSAARRFLAPLTQAMQFGGRSLTHTGSYYLPLSYPFTPNGTTVFALHVADGSQIITRRVGGPSLSVYVGSGAEQYGSCISRLQHAKLVDGYLPVLDTGYTDANGVAYRQESFVGRAYGVYGARSVISFVRLTIDTRKSDHDAVVRLVPWKRLAHSAPDRLALGGQTRLIVSDGAQFVDGVVRYQVPAHTIQTVYAEWLNAPSDAQYVHADETTYLTARSTVEKFWQDKLDAGASFQVPEATVQNAELATLTQVIAYAWRYSVGNPYEELSYAESLDAAEIATEYGYSTVARSIIQLALDRMRARPKRFTAARGAHILSTAALYYRLTHDKAFLHAATPELARLVSRISWRQIRSGKKKGQLLPEALSTDLEGHVVSSVPGQVEAVEALLAIGRVWKANGYPAYGSRARALADSIDQAIRPAIKKASVHMKDGSLFVPDALTGKKGKPYPRITGSRDGSYWNLVMPYALASGWFPAHSPAARGILLYLLQHGSRMLGVPRTYAGTVYGTKPGAGLAQVYGLSTSRFLADNDQPDQLDLTLYGMLANGMTQGTFVSGEAVSVLPLRGAYERSMFMPPNSGANASFLGTLRELLVHERRGAQGQPAGLDLAFSTPRAWLADGEEITVRDAPTSYGKVSYDLSRHGAVIEGTLAVPAYAHTRLRLRVPAGEHLTHVVVSGKVIAADSAGTIDLGTLHGALTLRATVGA